MTTKRAALGLIVLIGLGLGAFWTWPGSEAASPVATPVSAPFAPLRLAVASATPIADRPQPAAEPLARPAASSTGPGTEGYAPQIQRALAEGGPREAADAVELINSCRRRGDLESVLNGSHPVFGRPLLTAQHQELIASLRRHQQRCQTISDHLVAQRAALAQRAVDGEWPGAPKLLRDALAGDGARDEREDLMTALNEALARWRAEQQAARP